MQSPIRNAWRLSSGDSPVDPRPPALQEHTFFENLSGTSIPGTASLEEFRERYATRAKTCRLIVPVTQV